MNTKNISYGIFAVIVLALIVTSCSQTDDGSTTSTSETPAVMEVTPAVKEVVTPAVEEVVEPAVEEVVEPAVEEVVEPAVEPEVIPEVVPEVVPTEGGDTDGGTEGGDSDDTNTDSE